MNGTGVGVVLAGGLGSRLGGAKARAELAGRPLISYPLAAVEAAGLEPVVVAKAGSELPPLDCATVTEPDQPLHPLAGIVAALRHAGGRPVVAIGCDMPFASAELLAWLGRAAEALVVPMVSGLLQPLPGRYAAELLPALDEGLAASRPLRATIESLGPRLLAEGELAAFGDPHRLCFNVNTADDLERAALILHGG